MCPGKERGEAELGVDVVDVQYVHTVAALAAINTSNPFIKRYRTSCSTFRLAFLTTVPFNSHNLSPLIPLASVFGYIFDLHMSCSASALATLCTEATCFSSLSVFFSSLLYMVLIIAMEDH